MCILKNCLGKFIETALIKKRTWRFAPKFVTLLETDMLVKTALSDAANVGVALALELLRFIINGVTINTPNS